MMMLLSIGGFVTSYWWLFVAIGGVALFAAKVFLGLELAKLLKVAIEFFKTPGGQIIAAVVVFLLVASSLVQWGRNIEKANCDAAAKDARIKSLEQQVEMLSERYEFGAAVEAEIKRRTEAFQEEIKHLNSELEKAALQSTKPGSKKDAKALLDDRCRYTPNGARRMSVY